jgi:prophage regulatory protein
MLIHDAANARLQLLRPNDAARALGISTATLWRLSKRSDFPRAFRVGVQALAWSAAELEQWLETRRLGDAA